MRASLRHELNLPVQASDSHSPRYTDRLTAHVVKHTHPRRAIDVPSHRVAARREAARLLHSDVSHGAPVMKVFHKRPHTDDDRGRQSAALVKRPKQTLPNKMVRPRLPTELIDEVVKQLPTLPKYDAGEGQSPAANHLLTLSAVRSTSRGMAKAVEREHPEFVVRAASEAASAFISQGDHRRNCRPTSTPYFRVPDIWTSV